MAQQHCSPSLSPAHLPGIQIHLLPRDSVGRQESGGDFKGVEPTLVRPRAVEVDGVWVPHAPPRGPVGHVNQVVAVVLDVA